MVALRQTGDVLIMPWPMAARTAQAARDQVFPSNTGGVFTSDSGLGKPELSAIRTSLKAAFSRAGSARALGVPGVPAGISLVSL